MSPSWQDVCSPKARLLGKAKVICMGAWQCSSQIMKLSDKAECAKINKRAATMNVVKRTRKLKALLDIRIGPGAAELSNDVKRIHLDFAHKINDGHLGARKVWRQYLPRLKYHNPAISMTVNRTRDQDGPATLTITFNSHPKRSSATASPAPFSSTDPSTAPSGHAPVKWIETIDMKHKHESEILSRLLELTKGMPYEATSDELAELRDVDDEKRQSEKAREAQARLNEVKRQEKALLDLARGGVDAA